jgi:hypothetical protein
MSTTSTWQSFFVFNYLHGRTFLSSRKELVKELQRMLDFACPGSGAYEAAEFERFRRMYIQRLITEYTENIGAKAKIE